jgi:hypothetical protein
MDRMGSQGHGPGLRRVRAEAGAGLNYVIEEGRARLPIGADCFVFFFLLFGFC